MKSTFLSSFFVFIGLSLSAQAPIFQEITVNTFGNPVVFQTGSEPLSIVAGDLNNDGKNDLAVTNFNNGRNLTGNFISVYKNQSDIGNINLGVRLDLITDYPPCVIMFADVDFDGKKDIVVGNSKNNSGNTISIFRNISTQENLNFATKFDIIATNQIQKIIYADIDNDNKNDIIISEGFASGFSIFRNKSTIGNIAFEPRLHFDVVNSTYAYELDVADLNNDGKLDIITSRDAITSVFQNSSTLSTISFRPRIDLEVCKVGKGGHNLCVKDLDGDGKKDIVTTNCNDSSISIIRNIFETETLSEMSFQSKFSLKLDNRVFGIKIEDINGDGKMDIFASVGDVTQNSYVTIFQNQCDDKEIKKSSFKEKVNLPTNKKFIEGIEVKDIDGDNTPDIISTNRGDNTISIFKTNLILYSNIGSYNLSNLNIKIVDGNLKIENVEASRIKIYDITGRLVYFKPNALSIEHINLKTKGIYLLEVAGYKRKIVVD